MPPKVLLLSCTAPATNEVGGIILNDLCKMYPRDSICAYIVSSTPGFAKNSHGLDWLPLKEGKDCSWNLKTSRFGAPAKLLQWIKQFFTNRHHIQQLVTAAEKLGKQHNVDIIWSILDKPTTISMTRTLSKVLGVPYRVTVWDDIEHTLPYMKVDRLSQIILSREYKNVLMQSERCAVIGETMKADYDRIYDINSDIVRHGIHPDIVQKASLAISQQGPVNIGFVGSVTARSAFNSLVAALDSQDWKFGDRAVVLNLAGNRFDLSCQKPATIQYRGWLSVEESIKMLADCDINYLPQPFEPGLNALSRLSFPTKLTTYLAAGKPVLLHSPESSSLCEFMKNHPFGVSITKLDHQALVDGLKILIEDPDLYSNCALSAHDTLNHQFTATKFKQSFANFMGIEKAQLTG